MELNIASSFLVDTTIVIASLAGAQQVEKFLLWNKNPVYFQPSQRAPDNKLAQRFWEPKGAA